MEMLIQKIKKTLRSEKASEGFILLTAIMLITFMSIFSLALFARSTSFVRSAERNQNRIVAFNMAEAGIDAAIAAIFEDNSYEGTDYTSMTSGSMRGGYSIQVCPPSCDDMGVAEPADANVRIIAAAGFSPDNDSSSRAYESRSTQAYVEITSASLFEFAVFADDSMQLNGNPTVDSYNSNDGAYDPSNPGQNGDIGTNGTGAGAITLNGNADVKGDAAVGEGGDPDNDISISGNATVSGEKSALDAQKSFDSPSVPGGAVDLGRLRINGNSTYNLPAGTYYVDSLSISGNGTLNALGDVEIYVGGTVSISGNGISTSGNAPPSMLLYVTTDDTVSISGNGDLYAGIYAPDSHVQNTGNGDIYGAVVSDTYQQSGNGDMHYDEALNEIAGNGGGEIQLKAWAENNTLMA